MLGIGPLELLLIAVATLLLVGPERIPEVVRGIASTIHRLQSYWRQLYLEFKQESGLNGLEQDLRNDELMRTDKSNKKRGDSDSK